MDRFTDEWLNHTHTPIPARRAHEHTEVELGARNYTQPQLIACPRCGSTNTYRHGTRNGVQVYMCVECQRKFDDRGLAFGMRHTPAQIGAAVSMYYKGLSLSDIADEYSKQGMPVSRVSVYRWVTRYTEEALRLLGPLKVDSSRVWAVDETFITVAGERAYHWDCIDSDTRFLLGSLITRQRNTQAAVRLFRQIRERTDGVPEQILSDGLPSYKAAVATVFGRETTAHIVTGPFNGDINTNLIERWHGTLKDRTAVLRGLKSLESADTLLRGFVIDYNFMRPHISLYGQTPARAAGYTGPVSNWQHIVEWAHG